MEHLYRTTKKIIKIHYDVSAKRTETKGVDCEF
jgi:hypothetical protein